MKTIEFRRPLGDERLVSFSRGKDQSTMAKRQPARKNARSSSRSRRESATDTDTLITPDSKRATELVLELMAIPGKSGQEGAVAEFVERKLRDAGARAAMIQRDNVHRRSPFKGETGNLILKLPGTIRGPRRMFRRIWTPCPSVPVAARWCANAWSAQPMPRPVWEQMIEREWP